MMPSRFRPLRSLAPGHRLLVSGLRSPTSDFPPSVCGLLHSGLCGLSLASDIRSVSRLLCSARLGSDFWLLASGFWLLALRAGPGSSGFRPPTSDLRPPTSGLRPLPALPALPALPVASCRGVSLRALHSRRVFRSITVDKGSISTKSLSSKTLFLTQAPGPIYESNFLS
jgi:hypothetical protein